MSCTQERVFLQCEECGILVGFVQLFEDNHETYVKTHCSGDGSKTSDLDDFSVIREALYTCFGKAGHDRFMDYAQHLIDEQNKRMKKAKKGAKK